MFDLPPSVAIGTFALGVIYLTLAIGLRGPIRPSQALAFAAALIAILIVHGPIDALADRRLFFVHMIEHSMQTLVIPPLLLLGAPGWMIRPIATDRRIYSIARMLTNPIVSFSIFSALLVAVHFPAVFDRMCRDEPFHITVHLCFMSAGVLLWWPLLSPLSELPRISYPAQIMYLFALIIPMAAVAAPITLAPKVIYPWYLEGAHPWGLTALADQVLGGLVMWVGDGIYLMCVFSAIFFRWAIRDDRDSPLPVRRLERVDRASLRAG